MDRSFVRGLGLIALMVIIVGLAVIALIPNARQRLFPGIAGPTPEPSQAGPGSILISDDFSSPQWGTGTSPESSVEYANNALRMILHPNNSFVWSPLDGQEYQNIHMEVTVINNGTDSTTAFGLICNQQPIDESFYFFAITPAGEYAIARAAQGQSDVFLTNDDAWASSDRIATDAASYRVGADCGNGTLTLYVDGQQIASVADGSYSNGGVALFTWSGEEATTTDVSFDDFLMTELP